MPAQILHILYGEDVLLRAAAALRPALPAAADLAESLSRAGGGAFALGCQGPDLFYHNQRTRPVSLEYGTLLHRRGFGSFAAALLRRALLRSAPESIEPKDGPGPAAAYAVGFATHAFLDRACHPYIVSRSGWVSPVRPETERYARCHAFFERILDVLMLERLRGRSAATWDQESALSVPCDTADPRIAEAVVAALREVFPERAGGDGRLPARIANALSDASAFYRVTDPARTSLNSRLPDHFEYLASASGRASVALVYPERFPLDIDYLNLSRSPWAHPCEQRGESRASFVDLYEEAVASGAAFFAALFRSLLSDGGVPADAAALLGDGGLSVVDADGAPCAPKRSSPLPLDAILDAQYALRRAWIASRTRAAI